MNAAPPTTWVPPSSGPAQSENYDAVLGHRHSLTVIVLSNTVLKLQHMCVSFSDPDARQTTDSGRLDCEPLTCLADESESASDWQLGLLPGCSACADRRYTGERSQQQQDSRVEADATLHWLLEAL